MRFCIGLAALVLAHAALAGDLDTAKLDQVRSLVAEASAVEQADADGRLTGAYADGQRQALRKDLAKLLKDPHLAPFARGALAALDGHDAAALNALRDRLVAMERAHGRAG